MNPHNVGGLEDRFRPHTDDISRALREEFPCEFCQGDPIHAPSAFPEFKYRPDSENRVGRGVHSVYRIPTHNGWGNFAITGPRWEAKKNV
jgi:hypothetical protein